MTDMNKVLRDEARLDRKSHRRILIDKLLQKAKVKPVVTDATKKQD
jgi:hypothetical protein